MHSLNTGGCRVKRRLETWFVTCEELTFLQTYFLCEPVGKTTIIASGGSPGLLCYV